MTDFEDDNNLQHDPRVAASETKIPKALVNPNSSPEEIARITTEQSILHAQTSPVTMNQAVTQNINDAKGTTAQGIQPGVMQTSMAAEQVTNPPLTGFEREQVVAQNIPAPEPVVSKSKASLFLGILGGVTILSITTAAFVVMSDKRESQPEETVEQRVPTQDIEEKQASNAPDFPPLDKDINSYKDYDLSGEIGNVISKEGTCRFINPKATFQKTALKLLMYDGTVLTCLFERETQSVRKIQRSFLDKKIRVEGTVVLDHKERPYIELDSLDNVKVIQ